MKYVYGIIIYLTPDNGAGHQRWVWDCVFSVDGAYLVTGKSCVVIY